MGGVEYLSHDVAETEAIGEELARRLRAGSVVAYRGGLGMGKTAFTRGLARGLGCRGRVTSPTFTIMQLHDSGRLPLYHFDWYRLSDPEELYELSMDEYLHAGGVAVVEWPSRAEEAVPECYLEVSLEPVGENARRITFTPVGGFRELDWKGLSL